MEGTLTVRPRRGAKRERYFILHKMELQMHSLRVNTKNAAKSLLKTYHLDQWCQMKVGKAHNVFVVSCLALESPYNSTYLCIQSMGRNILTHAHAHTHARSHYQHMHTPHTHEHRLTHTYVHTYMPLSSTPACDR